MTSMLVFTFLVAVACVSGEAGTFEIRMPSVRPQTDDLTLCYARRIDSPIFFTGFEPMANKSINHHIIVYGCGDSAGFSDLDRVWDCGEMNDMNNGVGAETYPKDSICPDNQPPKFIYAWAMGAPSFNLPADVSYEVGTNEIRYLVLQQHYKDTSIFRPPSKLADRAGVKFSTASEPTRRLAGIFLLASGYGVLPPHQTSYFDIACGLEKPEGLRMHPFAYRTHTHSNGVVISGYRVRNGIWTEIGRQSPQLPQTFYPVTTPDMDIRQDDVLTARCTMFNNNDNPVQIGGTQYDEMCNFYIYYYTERGEKRPDMDYCMNLGPPYYSWADDFLNLDSIPDTVSVVPPPPPGVMPMDHHHGSSMPDAEMPMNVDKIREEDLPFYESPFGAYENDEDAYNYLSRGY